MSEPHILPLRIYLMVFGALMLLTAITTAAALVDMGPLNTTVAMSIAITKLLLVVLYFMHVRYSGKLVWIFAGAGLLWLAILITITMSDYFTRVGVPGWTGP